MDSIELTKNANALREFKILSARILGPTVSLMEGNGLESLSARGVENIKKVFIAAEKRLGGKINNKGQVPARVLKNILNEAYFCESEVAKEYFGGILASSRSNDARDDRGAYFSSIIGRLSTYQIRSHYVLYHNFKYVFNGKRLPFSLMELDEKASVFIPLTNYIDAMECGRAEGMNPYLEHAVTGLIGESLISQYFAHGSSTFYRLKPPTGLENSASLGIVAAPTRLGLELFLWCYGEGWQPPHQVFFSGNIFPIIAGTNLTFEGVTKTPVAKEWGPETEPASI